MEIKSIKAYQIGKLHCYACETELDLEYIKRIELVDGAVLSVCSRCCERIAKVCGIEVETIDKPNVDECNKCSIRFKCYTTREKDE